MSRQLWLAPFGLFTIFALFAAIGCDEPNDPDIPRQPYRLAAIYDPGSPIVDVSAGENIVAIAIQYLGYDVLNVTDVNLISRVDSLRFSEPGRLCEAVAVDPTNSLIAVSVIPPVYDEIRDFANHTFVSGYGATGVLDMHFYSRQDTADMWFAQSGTDVRIGSTRLVRGTSGWSLSPGITWQPIDNGVRMGHFAIRNDGIVASTFQAGLHLIDSKTFQSLDTFLTPGQAFGTAWYGNYIIVAAEYYMLVIDASDTQNLSIVQQMEIRGADRLRQVAVDGSFAALLDNNDGIYIVDISNVTSSQLVQTITLIDPSSVAAADHRFYFTDLARGLLIYTR